jgi:hypothetical protein
LIRAGPEVERQGDRRTVCLLNVFTEVKTVLRIKAPLIPAAGILIKYIRKTEPIEQLRRRETDEDLPLSSPANDSVDLDVKM